MNLPVIIIGAGGHARVLISVLKTKGMDILGITDITSDKVVDHINGISVLGQDDIILQYAPDSILLVNGIGSVGSTVRRETVYKKFKQHGYSFASVIHLSAVIMDEVQLGEGVQIMAGAIVQPGCLIGNNSIINTGAIIDHDCVIGDHAHVAPGAVLSGGVHIGSSAHIGTSATVIQGSKIGQRVIVGAGAVVINDIPANAKVTGVPASFMERR
jgi:UDP-perosamine 4-acetyltransferase